LLLLSSQPEKTAGEKFDQHLCTDQIAAAVKLATHELLSKHINIPQNKHHVSIPGFHQYRRMDRGTKVIMKNDL